MVRDSFDRFLCRRPRATGSGKESARTTGGTHTSVDKLDRSSTTAADIPDSMLSQLVAYKRRQYTQRWRLYDVTADNIRLFVEEKKATFEEEFRLEVRSVVEVAACWIALVAVSLGLLWLSAVTCLVCVIVGVPALWILAGPIHRPRSLSRECAYDQRTWRLTGRIKASCLIGRPADDVFRMMYEQNKITRYESKWSLEFESGRLIEAVDRHTDVVEVIEKVGGLLDAVATGESVLGSLARKMLAFHARSSRLMRYWRKDDDGGYTVVLQSVAANPSFHTYSYSACCGSVEQDVKGTVVEMRPALHPPVGVVVTEAADVDSKLSWFSAFFCWIETPSWLQVPPDSPVAVAFHAHRLKLRLRGLRSCALQLCDEDTYRSGADSLKTTPAQALGSNELYRGDELSPRHAKKRVGTGKVQPPRSADEHSISDRTVAPAFTPSEHGAALNPELKELFRFLSSDFKRATAPYESNAFDEPPPEHFNVRGPHYLEDGKKVPAASAGCRLVRVGTLRCDRPLEFIASWPHHGVEDTFDGLVVNFLMPYDGRSHLSFLFYFIDTKMDPAFSRRLRAFTNDMTDAQRNEHFKLIPFLQDGPWVARHALGQKPTLLGRNIHTKYHVRHPVQPGGGTIIEIDVDVSTGPGASAVWRIMKGVAKALVIDLAFLFESKTQSDLPETLIGSARIMHFDFGKHDNPAVTHIQASLDDESSTTETRVSSGRMSHTKISVERFPHVKSPVSSAAQPAASTIRMHTQ